MPRNTAKRAGSRVTTRVTVTFQLSPMVDPNRFLEWLSVECANSSDGAGDIEVTIEKPVRLELYDWETGGTVV